MTALDKILKNLDNILFTSDRCISSQEKRTKMSGEVNVQHSDKANQWQFAGLWWISHFTNSVTANRLLGVKKEEEEEKNTNNIQETLVV